jgi:hypothetical protein
MIQNRMRLNAVMLSGTSGGKKPLADAVGNYSITNLLNY